MSIPNAHRKQLQNFIRNRVVHETGSHIFLPFIRNFRERHLQISAGGNILFGNGANHGKDFFCFNSSYPTVRRILHSTALDDFIVLIRAFFFVHKHLSILWHNADKLSRPWLSFSEQGGSLQALDTVPAACGVSC